jgi:hypothetical protein
VTWSHCRVGSRCQPSPLVPLALRFTDARARHVSRPLAGSQQTPRASRGVVAEASPVSAAPFGSPTPVPRAYKNSLDLASFAPHVPFSSLPLLRLFQPRLRAPHGDHPPSLIAAIGATRSLTRSAVGWAVHEEAARGSNRGVAHEVPRNSSPALRPTAQPHRAVARRLGAITIGEYSSSVFARPCSSCTTSWGKEWCSG